MDEMQKLDDKAVADLCRRCAGAYTAGCENCPAEQEDDCCGRLLMEAARRLEALK